MKRWLAALAVCALLIPALAAQRSGTLTPQTGDAALDAALVEISASAQADTGTFTVEVSAQWNVPAPAVETALKELAPGDVYMAAALSSIASVPLDDVIKRFKKKPKQGWGALAKDLGIKPGSADFKSLKDKAAASSGKLKGKKK